MTDKRQEKGKAIALKSDLIRLSDNHYHVHSQTRMAKDSLIIDGGVLALSELPCPNCSIVGHTMDSCPCNLK